MLIVVKVKDTDNIIGLKEDIAARLEDMVDIDRIGVFENGDIERIYKTYINPSHRKDGAK